MMLKLMLVSSQPFCAKDVKLMLMLRDVDLGLGRALALAVIFLNIPHQ